MYHFFTIILCHFGSCINKTKGTNKIKNGIDNNTGYLKSKWATYQPIIQEKANDNIQ